MSQAEPCGVFLCKLELTAPESCPGIHMQRQKRLAYDLREWPGEKFLLSVPSTVICSGMKSIHDVNITIFALNKAREEPEVEAPCWT